MDSLSQSRKGRWEQAKAELFFGDQVEKVTLQIYLFMNFEDEGIFYSYVQTLSSRAVEGQPPQGVSTRGIVIIVPIFYYVTKDLTCLCIERY